MSVTLPSQDIATGIIGRIQYWCLRNLSDSQSHFEVIEHQALSLQERRLIITNRPVINLATRMRQCSGGRKWIDQTRLPATHQLVNSTTHSTGPKLFRTRSKHMRLDEASH